MKQIINGSDFRRLVISAAASVEINKQKLNDLNVFPVPDGDTGTNMSMTINAAASDLRKLEDPSLEKAAAATSSAMLRGARVILVSGRTAVEKPPFVEVVDVASAQDMFEAVAAHCEEADFIFKAAAVADYTPANYSDNKMKKKDEDMSIPLKRTQDILKYLGEHRREGQVICGFSMETQDMVANSQAKLIKKKVDMICANNLKVDGAGFGVDTNILTLITADGAEELPLMSKEEAASQILDRAVQMAKK